MKQLHGFVQESIEKSTDKLIISQNMSTASKEYKLNGELGDKKIDIAIFKDRNSTMEDLESAISVKFVFSNYIQNATNYLEQMIAESLNITLSDKKSYHLVILRRNVPYFTKSKQEIKKIEKISNEYIIKKYHKLLISTKMQIFEGICLIVADFNDLDIIEKFESSSFQGFSFKEYAQEILENISRNTVSIAYPLIEEGYEKAITFEELVEMF